MSVAEWADTYGIQHWQILWSSYRKMAWVGFELTDWAIKAWVQLVCRANDVER